MLNPFFLAVLIKSLVFMNTKDIIPNSSTYSTFEINLVLIYPLPLFSITLLYSTISINQIL